MPLNRADFPFEHLGLVRNPFGTLQADEWADVAVLPQVVQPLLTDTAHVLFTGEKGRGKTSLLYAMRQHMAFSGLQTAYERLPHAMTGYQTNPNRLDVFALDEVQRLRPWCWWSLLRQARRGTRLLLGGHVDVSLLFRLAGLPLRTLHMDNLITPAHIETVHTRRIAYFTLPDSEPLPLADSATAYLWQQYGSNLRAQESLLYDVIQQMQQPEVITAAHLQRADTASRSNDALSHTSLSFRRCSKK